MAEPFPGGTPYSLFPSFLTGNTVTANTTGHDIPGSVYGGVADGVGSGEVSGNQVFLFGSGVVGSVYGSGNVYGSYNYYGNAADSRVYISGGSVLGVVCGSWSHEADAANGTVSISGGSVVGEVCGSYSQVGVATNGAVSISGGSVDSAIASISGSWSYRGDATNGTVNISGGSVNLTALFNQISGSWAYDGDATNGTVNISGGSVVATEVFGSWSYNGDATGSTVDISGGSLSSSSSIYGGYSYGGDAFTGNILKFSADPVTVDTVANFQEYSFALDPSSSATALITASDSITLGDNNTGVPSVIEVASIRSGPALQVGDTFILMESGNITNHNGAAQDWVWQDVVQQNSSLRYDVEVKITQTQVIATIQSVRQIAVAPIPTLSEWGMILTASLLALSAFPAMRRRG